MTSQVNMLKNRVIEPHIPTTPIKYIGFLLKDQKWIAFGIFLVVTIAQTLGTSTAYVLGKIIESAEGVGSQTATVDDVWFWALAFPLTMAVVWTFWRLSGFLGKRLITTAVARSYKVLFDYVGKHSHTYFSNRFAGSLSSKISHASDGSQSLLDAFIWHYYPGILALVLTAAYILNLSLFAGAIFIGLLLVLIPLNIALGRYRRPHVLAYSLQTTKMRGRLIDSLTNIVTVRQYAQNEYEVQRFDDEVQLSRKLDSKQWSISEWGLVLNNVLIVVFELALISFIIHLWTKGTVSTGEFIMIITLLLNINATLVFIGNSISGFIRRYSEVEEGLADILLPYEIMDTAESATLNVKEGVITFDAVDFEFGANKVFDNFNLVIAPGQRVGLVGHSGAGKTTFVSLLLRQHDVTSGAITIDGQNIAQVTQDSLRQAIAIVPQEPLLFHRTIRENIAYGKPDATDKDIIEVAIKAQAHDFIVQLEKGYDTLVGERGIKLSGGQRQRIAIARAMLKDAPILVLDEATSALDSESEVAIQSALHTLMEGKTVVAIAHRLSTLREMDRIIVLENGQIVEDGNHESLKESGGVYQRLWEHQAGGFLVE